MSNKKIKIGTSACLILLLAVLTNFFYYYRHESFNTPASVQSLNETNWLKDWHNYEEIEAALNAKGLGEVGRPASFEDYRKELYDKYGFDALLSDSISLQRSVPDVRPAACKNISYLSKLPLSTIVITFHNERLSTLLRTIYSILNRSPAELLEEIILVDDGSTWPDMLEGLDQNLQLHFSSEKNKVKLIRQTKRGGIMVARMAGARYASTKAEVLIFLDSHFEVGYNWLPPLLDPIAVDRRTCTSPIIDHISFATFKYTGVALVRGFFDYSFNYRLMPPTAEMYAHPERNFRNYVMMGGALAIGRDFFWELGGFDEGMTFWGGEQFEMSFKIWMCGGQLLDVPCSRVGHLYRDSNTKGNSLLYGDYEYCNRNYKRILDVWIDEKNRQFFLEKRQALKKIDAGDLLERHAIRQRLQCKSFSWMLENIMPDIHDVFLPIEPADLAWGLVRSLHSTKFCMGLNTDQQAILLPCPLNNQTILENMSWRYTWRGEFRILDKICLESDVNSKTVGSFNCHFSFGNQKWYYDRNTQWIRQLEAAVCIKASPEEQSIRLAACDMQNVQLKWTLSHMNQTEMDQWEEKLKILRP